MKRFVSVYQMVFLGKTPIVLVALILTGSVIGCSLMLYSTHRTSTNENCSSLAEQYITTSNPQSCSNKIHLNQTHTIGQTNPKSRSEAMEPEQLSIPRQTAPNPTLTPKPQP